MNFRYVNSPVKIVLTLWHEEPIKQSFSVSPDLLEDCNTWIHEFTELAVWYTIQKITKFPKEKINVYLNIPTDTYYPEKLSISHIITSLCTPSIYNHKGFNEVLTPSQFEKILFKQK